MKATFEFDMTEQGDVIEHKRHTKSLDMALALFKIKDEIRAMVKYAPDDMPKEEYEAWKEIQEKVRNILFSCNIDLDELLQ